MSNTHQSMNGVGEVELSTQEDVKAGFSCLGANKNTGIGKLHSPRFDTYTPQVVARYRHHHVSKTSWQEVSRLQCKIVPVCAPDPFNSHRFQRTKGVASVSVWAQISQTSFRCFSTPYLWTHQTTFLLFPNMSAIVASIMRKALHSSDINSIPVSERSGMCQ